MHVHNVASKYMNHKTDKTQGKGFKSTIVVGDLHIPFKVIKRTTGSKIYRYVNHLDLINIYRTQHSAITDYRIFSGTLELYRAQPYTGP